MRECHKVFPVAGSKAIRLVPLPAKTSFAGSGTNLMAFDPATGKTLWHSRIGNQANAPETYMLDGHQYLLAVAGDTMFAFTLY